MKKLVKDLTQQVRTAEGQLLSVQQLKAEYQAAHPAFTIVALDYGEQVFVGRRLGGYGIWADKVKD